MYIPIEKSNPITSCLLDYTMICQGLKILQNFSYTYWEYLISTSCKTN